MSDETAAPAEAPAPDAGPTDPEEQPRRYWGSIAIGVVIALVLLALFIWMLLQLRGCNSTPVSQSAETSASVGVPVPAATTLALRDRIHGALHSGELTDGTPLDDMVYLWKLTKKNGIVCTVTLTISAPDPNVPRNKAAHIAATNPKKVAAQVEDAILTGVPEITRVVVVNSKGAIVSEASRK